MQQNSISLWGATSSAPRFDPLSGDLRADVAVIGAGITGITAALRLARAGRQVVLLEGAEPAAGESGHTSAHLTFVYDTRLVDLCERFGSEGARNVWDALHLGFSVIEDNVAEFQIDCDYEKVPGYLLGVRDVDVELFEREHALIHAIGYSADLLAPDELAALPFRAKTALRVPEQARFHPRRYLAALLRRLPGAGCPVFASTQVTEVVSGARPVLKTENGREVRCNSVVIASHVPFNNRLLIHHKQAAYRT
jgi:glycine/D-amino acid oxidase-like deaminating enzyme